VGLLSTKQRMLSRIDGPRWRAFVKRAPVAKKVGSFLSKI